MRDEGGRWGEIVLPADLPRSIELLAVVVDFGRITAENLFHLAPH